MLEFIHDDVYPIYYKNINTRDWLYGESGENIEAGDLVYSDKLDAKNYIYGVSPIQSLFLKEVDKLMEDDNLINKVYNDLMGVKKDPLKLEITYE